MKQTRQKLRAKALERVKKLYSGEGGRALKRKRDREYYWRKKKRDFSSVG